MRDGEDDDEAEAGGAGVRCDPATARLCGVDRTMGAWSRGCRCARLRAWKRAREMAFSGPSNSELVAFCAFLWRDNSLCAAVNTASDCRSSFSSAVSSCTDDELDVVPSGPAAAATNVSGTVVCVPVRRNAPKPAFRPEMRRVVGSSLELRGDSVGVVAAAPPPATSADSASIEDAQFDGRATCRSDSPSEGLADTDNGKPRKPEVSGATGDDGGRESESSELRESGAELGRASTVPPDKGAGVEPGRAAERSSIENERTFDVGAEDCSGNEGIRYD